jgi:hypothetical protein
MTVIELAPIFQAVREAMVENRLAFNQADKANANHGDHMVEIFEAAVQAAGERQADGLAEAMDYAGELLRRLEGNGSAQVYARGLNKLGEQFRRREITLEDLVAYLGKVLKEEKQASMAAPGNNAPASPAPSKDVLKALVTALAAWQQGESGEEKSGSPVDLGYLFDLGIVYLQAKGRNPTRVAALADAAATVSPLSKSPHRYESGKLAIATLLRAMEQAKT